MVEAEKRHIVHRDIKPQNIVITQEGQFKLADLGIAKNLDQDNDLSQTGGSKGTVPYMPLEQIKDAKHVDHRADIYSLGVTLYEMVTGELPFSGNQRYEIEKKIECGQFKLPHLINPSLNMRLSNIICKMMALKPENRFQSAQHVMNEFEKSESSDPVITPDNPGIGKIIIASLVVGTLSLSTFIVFLQPNVFFERVSKPDHNMAAMAEKIASLVKKSWYALPADNISVLNKQKMTLDQQVITANQYLAQEQYEQAFQAYLLTLKSLRKLRESYQFAEMCRAIINEIRGIRKNVESIHPELFNKQEWKHAELLQANAKASFESGQFTQSYKQYESAHNEFRALFSEFSRTNSNNIQNKRTEFQPGEMTSNLGKPSSEATEIAESLFPNSKTQEKENETDVKTFPQLIPPNNSVYHDTEEYRNEEITGIKSQKKISEEDQEIQTTKEIIATVLEPVAKPETSSNEPVMEFINKPLKTADNDHSPVEISRDIAEEIPNRKIALAVRSSDGRKNYFSGENLSLTLRSEKDCYLAIFYHYTDGSTVLLFPNQYLPELFVPANEYFRIPDESNITKGFQLEVSEPFGSDVIQVIACSEKRQLDNFLKGYISMEKVAAQPIEGGEIKRRLRGIRRGVNLKMKLEADWGEANVLITTQQKRQPNEDE